VRDKIETPQQRRERLLQRAAEAEARALATTDPTTRNEWEKIARKWTALAYELPTTGH
jgi:hypothetical protein